MPIYLQVTQNNNQNYFTIRIKYAQRMFFKINFHMSEEHTGSKIISCLSGPQTARESPQEGRKLVTS